MPQDIFYTISESSTGAGSADPTGDTEVLQGGSQFYTITPNSGWFIHDVFVDGPRIGRGSEREERCLHGESVVEGGGAGFKTVDQNFFFLSCHGSANPDRVSRVKPLRGRGIGVDRAGRTPGGVHPGAGGGNGRRRGRR